MRPMVFLIAAVACAAPASGQQIDVERYVREHQPAIIREFMDLVAIPNVRSDLPNIKRNAEFLRQMLERRGMKPEIWETPSTPLVYGERLVPGATRTILFYIHFDGQPVDKGGWMQADPWTPIIRAGALEEGAGEVRALEVRVQHLERSSKGCRTPSITGRYWRTARRRAADADCA